MNPNVYLLMNLYQVIIHQGAATEQGHSLDGIEVISGADGYDLLFRGEGAEFRVGFHHTLWQQCDSDRHRNAFLKQAQQIVGRGQSRPA